MCLQTSWEFVLTLHFTKSTDFREVSDNQPVGLNSQNDRKADAGESSGELLVQTRAQSRVVKQRTAQELCPAMLYLQIDRGVDEASDPLWGPVNLFQHQLPK